MITEVNSIVTILQSLEKQLEAKDRDIKRLEEMVEQLSSKVWLHQEALAFFDRIPQAKPKIIKLKEQLKAIDSVLNQ